MCGIVGASAQRSITQLLLNGLKKMEYRGYDSAGIAVINHQNELKRLRAVGKVRELEAILLADPLEANIGIAHTRWATHGIPCEKNAHPFISRDNRFVLVHNGIIENHRILRERLLKKGYQFGSDTDTETVVHLVDYHYRQSKNLISAIRSAVNELKGAYALGIFCMDFPDRVIGVRQGAPLVVGIGHHENFLASDPLALLSVTQQFIYLEDGDIADISNHTIQIYDQHNQLVQREKHILSMSPDVTERGEYRHYMKKEIMEQPNAVTACLEGRIAKDQIMPAIFGPAAEKLFQAVEHVQLIACGTSYHAAMTARYWIESLAGIPCSVEVASEFRYRNPVISKNSLFVTLSQSGETADTLAALRLAKKMRYLSTLAICNVPNSTLMRETDLHFLTHAGVEIGVASTKSFTTQLAGLFLLTMALRQGPQDQVFISALSNLPTLIQTVLQQDQAIADWAKFLMNKQHALFLGRGVLYPIALEGALKMKELSYIHAEAYPSGELKHGPLALVDNTMPLITMVPNDALIEKNLSNLQEVRARGGKLFILTDQTHLFEEAIFSGSQIIKMPPIHSALVPILYSIPLQLLAYHVAVLKGTDVDQPRNLAKSVTVE